MDAFQRYTYGYDKQTSIAENMLNMKTQILLLNNSWGVELSLCE